MTFAAVTIRVGIGVGFASGMRFENFDPILSWISRAPSLLVAEWIVRKTKPRSARNVLSSAG